MFPLLYISKIVASSVFALGIMVSSVYAGDDSKEPSEGGKSVSGYAVLGVGVAPEFEGSEDYTAIPFIAGRVQYEQRYIDIAGPALSINVLNSSRFNLGPAVSFRGGRDDDIENETVARLGEIDDAIEAGMFARINFKPDLRNGDRASLEVRFLADTSDAHDGWIKTIGANYSAPITQKLTLGMNVSTTYASEDYMQTYFGVTSAGANASGLRQYEAEEGFKDAAFGVNARYAFNDRWGVMARVQYTQLLDDATDSPIVDGEGSEGQVFASLGVSYRF